MKLRKGLVLWHRWFGLLGGVWLFALALTGSVVVFYEELDHALNADLFRLEPQGDALTNAELLAAAEAEVPGTYASFVDLPDAAGEPLVAYLSSRGGGEAAGTGEETEIPPGLHVFVDPGTGEVLAQRVWGAFELDRRHLSSLIYRLHRDLHLGRFGTLALGLLALLWLVDHLASAVLSFPQPKRWLESFRVKKGAWGIKKTWSLHRALGLWLLPVTFVLALSGVYFNWYGLFVDAVDAVSPVTPRHEKTVPALAEPLYEAPADLDAALAAFRVRDPRARVDSVVVLPHVGLYALRVFDERDLGHYGARHVHVDMATAEVVSDRHARDGSAGDEFLAWQYPLHSGQAFGWAGRLAVFLAGLATCTLTATGFVIWARKRRGRVRVRRGAWSGVAPMRSMAASSRATLPATPSARSYDQK